MSARILIVDDHALFREGVRSLLEKRDFEVVGEAGDGVDAIQRAGELLTNVIKHAKAGRVRVRLACADQEFQIAVKDDGLGFDPGVVLMSAGSAGTFGLFSIQERMKDLGGSIEISSAPDEGCEVSLMMPLKENTENGGQE